MKKSAATTKKRKLQKRASVPVKKIPFLQKALHKKDEEIRNIRRSLDYLSLKTEILLTVSQTVASGVYDADALLSNIVELSLRITQVEAGSLLLIDKEKNELYFKAAKGPKAHQLGDYRLKSGEGIAGWVAKHGVPAMVSDVRQDPRWKPDVSVLLDFPTRSILCVPLKKMDDVIGVLELINKQFGKTFTEDDRSLLELLANQATVVLQNADLLQQSSEKIAELTALADISTMITSTLDLQEVLKDIVDLATRLMRAEACSILLYDETTKELYFEAAEGEKEEEVKKFRLKLGQGICGWVSEKLQPLVIEDAYQDSRFNRKVDEETGFRTRSILCVPMQMKGKLVGVVEVLNSIGRPYFKNEDVDLFQSLANQAAVAIENAKLYRDRQELFLGTVRSLAEVIDAKSPYTHGHSVRVSQYGKAIARALGYSREEQEKIELSGLLHDIGKIGISEAIINKPDKLTDQEYNEMKRHPTLGTDILSHVAALKDVLPGVRGHHERFDGKGYPDGISGENINILGRVLAVADTFDAMTSTRPYRKRLPIEVAVGELKRCSGTQFDPVMVEAFMQAVEDGVIQPIMEEQLIIPAAEGAFK